MRLTRLESSAFTAQSETAASESLDASNTEKWLGIGISDSAIAMPWQAPKAPKGERGYTYAYLKLRKQLLPKAYGTPCVRCGELMLPGQKLHLDHDDYDRSIIRGFSHSWCNIRAAARKARAIQTAAKMAKTRTDAHRW